jgi:hypothetical protein
LPPPAGEDVLELEPAVQQQEDMALKLHQLTPAERSEFIRLLNQVADESPYDAERASLRSPPEHLGIA